MQRRTGPRGGCCVGVGERSAGGVCWGVSWAGGWHAAAMALCARPGALCVGGPGSIPNLQLPVLQGEQKRGSTPYYQGSRREGRASAIFFGKGILARSTNWGIRHSAPVYYMFFF